MPGGGISKLLAFGRDSGHPIKRSHLRWRRTGPEVSITLTMACWPGGTITNSHHPSKRNPASARLCSQPSQKLTIAMSGRISFSHLDYQIVSPYLAARDCFAGRNRTTISLSHPSTLNSSHLALSKILTTWRPALSESFTKSIKTSHLKRCKHLNLRWKLAR